MTKQQCQTCMEWFEDSELDAHLNEHIGLKGRAGVEEQVTTQRPGRRGEFLGAISSIIGLIATGLLGGLIALGASFHDPPYDVSLSESLLFLSWLCGSALGIAGAWGARKFRIAGGIALLIGGLLPLVATLSLLLPFSTSDYVGLVYGFILFQLWALLLLLAGLRALSDSRRPAADLS